MGVESNIQKAPGGTGSEQDPDVAVAEDGGVGQVLVQGGVRDPVDKT